MRLRINPDSAQSTHLSAHSQIDRSLRQRRGTFATKSQSIAATFNSSTPNKGISKPGCGKTIQRAWRNRLSQLAFWSGLIASAVSKGDRSACVSQINLKGTHSKARNSQMIDGLTIGSALSAPRGRITGEFESAHHTRVIKTASGDQYYAKTLESDHTVGNTRRSLPLLNMRRNMAIMDVLGIKYPSAQVTVQDGGLELYVQQMPNFKTFHQMRQEDTPSEQALSPENRAKYIAAIMLIDDLQDQNVGLQSGKDLAIIDFDCAYNTYYDNLFEPFNNLYYIFGDYYLQTKPTRQDLNKAYELLDKMLKNSDQLAQRFKVIYPISQSGDGVDPFNEFVESTLEKMDCLKSLAELSEHETVDVPTMGCLSMRIKDELKQKRGSDSLFYQKNDQYLTTQVRDLVTDTCAEGAPKACPKSTPTKQPNIELPEGAVWAIKDLFRPNDPSTFQCVEYIGQGSSTMEVKINDVSGLQTRTFDDAYTFKAHVSPDKSIEVIVNPEVGDHNTTHAMVQYYARIIGQFPKFIQNGVEKIYIHNEGGDAYSANGYANSILIYKTPFEALFSGETHNNLEEALFYLCAQAALDVNSKTFPEYEKAIAKDAQVLTKHAAGSNTRVDLIESLPLIYASVKRPDRIGPEIKNLVEQTPNRKEYFQKNIFKLTDLRGAKL